MQVTFAFLCDYAFQDQGTGKITAAGIGIDNLTIQDLNSPVLPFYLVVNFEGAKNEAGKKLLSIHLMDDDGNLVIEPMTGPMHFQAPPGGTKIGAGITASLIGVTFPRYGSYQMSVTLDGHEYVNLRFTVTKAPPAPIKR